MLRLLFILLLWSSSAQADVIDRLDAKLRTLTFDNQAKSIADAKTPRQVVMSGQGDCLEIARLAKSILDDKGYVAALVGLGFSDGQHAICVFQEDDGTWGYVSASRFEIAVHRCHAADIRQMLIDNFPTMEWIDYDVK